MIDLTNSIKTQFNIIASGTGTGKTYFIANNIHQQLEGVHNSEILFVASRSLIVDQQSKNDAITKFNKRDSEIIDFWNGKRDRSLRLHNQGIQIMTYDKIIDIITKKNYAEEETLKNIKVIVFDECHTLFSDKFINDMESLKVWIRDTLYKGNKLILGMTATPNILYWGAEQWGVKLNLLNKEPLFKYKAKQLTCTTFDSIPYLVTTKLEGRTMIMCYSYSDCKKLKEQIPDSFIMISQRNDDFTEEMEQVRQYIVSNETVPEYYLGDDGKKHKLNVLITTSTMREGINLRESGGIKNIVCCFSDELHITQFAGRARYDLDNLVVADTYIRIDNTNQNSYLAKCRRSYKDFMEMKDNMTWFMSIANLIYHPVHSVVRYAITQQEEKFIEYINKRWLVPKDVENIEEYRIYKEEDKKEIVKMAIQTKLIKAYPSEFTFFKVYNIMKNGLGYAIEDRRSTILNKQTRYKLIVDFDFSKIDLEYVNSLKWNTKVK